MGKGLIDRFPIVEALDTWIQHQYDFLRPLNQESFQAYKVTELLKHNHPISILSIQ